MVSVPVEDGVSFGNLDGEPQSLCNNHTFANKSGSFTAPFDVSAELKWKKQQLAAAEAVISELRSEIRLLEASELSTSTNSFDLNAQTIQSTTDFTNSHKRDHSSMNRPV